MPVDLYLANQGANDALRFLSLLMQSSENDVREIYYPLSDDTVGLTFTELICWLICHKDYLSLVQPYYRYYGIDTTL